MNTTFGLMPANTSLIEKEAILQATGIKTVRQPFFVMQGTGMDWMLQLLKDGYNVIPNFDWSTTVNPAPFPTNSTLIRNEAEQFFYGLKDYVGQIPFIAVENEWNNPNFHTGKSMQSTIQDYLNELAIVTSVGHKYGFKIADAGISGTGLQYWAAYKLSRIDRRKWIREYKVPVNSASWELLINAVEQYMQGIRLIPIDFLNVHWYEQDICYNGFDQAAAFYQNDCKKSNLICNEFGIRGTYSNDLLSETINSVKGIVDYAVLYSGNNALSISNEQIKTYLK